MRPSILKNIFTFSLLLFDYTAFTQQVSSPPVSKQVTADESIQSGQRCPPCQDLFIESAHILPALYLRKSFDSIAVFLATRSECCPNDADAYCLKILLAIETNRFTWEDLASPMLYFHLRDGLPVLAKVISGKGCNDYYSFRHFNGCPYAIPIFTLINDWAKDLIASHSLDSTQLFLCNLLLGNLANPIQRLRKEQLGYRFLDSPLVKAYELHRDKQKNINVSIGMGAWLPDGPLKTLGAHPGIYASTGIRNRRNEWDLTGGALFLDAPQSYTILVNDSVHTGHHVDGWIFGLEYDYYISHAAHFEWGLMAGTGCMGVDISYKLDGTSKYIYQNPSSIYESLGLRANYFYDRYNPARYIGLNAKYSFLHYGNTDGINLGGNALSIDISYGGNH